MKIKEDLFYVKPLYYDSSQKRYIEQNCEVYITRSEIKQLILDNTEIAQIVTSEGPAYTIKVSAKRAREIISIIEDDNG
jgi:hypothetical protein